MGQDQTLMTLIHSVFFAFLYVQSSVYLPHLHIAYGIIRDPNNKPPSHIWIKSLGLTSRRCRRMKSVELSCRCAASLICWAPSAWKLLKLSRSKKGVVSRETPRSDAAWRLQRHLMTHGGSISRKIRCCF